MKKALVVGIDHYTDFKSLTGCVNDAHLVAACLERNADEAKTLNFQTPRLLVASDRQKIVKRGALRDAVRELFADDADVALFYFAGHGHIDDAGGFLCASDCQSGDDGLSLNDVMTFARGSEARNKIIILDSCHSGILGSRPGNNGTAEISEGMTLLTASTANQYAYESGATSQGVFTNLLVDALNGAAANLVGEITPGSVYAHIDQSLGTWAQRPVFKTNVKKFVSLRTVTPPIPLADLRALSTYFPRAGFSFKLNPSFEPERSTEQLNDPTIAPPDPANTKTFAVLQNYVRVNLARPIDAPHMWHAAMYKKSCELTALGEHYRRLVEQKLI